jgi:hypothetical protein
MPAHFHNLTLEAHVARALAQHNAHHVTIHAALDGTVRLIGRIPTEVDITQIKRDVKRVPGVTHVFFNVARQPDE